MSKYNLTNIHKGIIKEGMSRGGTVKDSFRGIATIADDIDGENIGKDTYPIYVQRLGATEDDKTYEEFSIRYGEGKNDRFHIYDYKFGEDPTSEENAEEEYPFSLGVPTGNKDAKQWATKLGFDVSDSMFEENDPKHKDGTPKSNAEMTDDEREDYYMNLDSVDESKEDLDESPNLDALAKKLGISVEDLAAKVAKFQSTERDSIDSRAKSSMAEEDAKSPQQQKADYDETYADEIGTIVGDDKYTEEDVLKWVGSFEGDSFGDLYDKAPTVKNYSYDEDGEEVEDDEVYYKTMDAASEFWNKQLDDYFNNSDTQLKEHFQRFLKDYQ